VSVILVFLQLKVFLQLGFSKLLSVTKRQRGTDRLIVRKKVFWA
jgi:hypothetical protein